MIWHLSRTTQFRDNPPNPDYAARQQPEINRFAQVYTADRPGGARRHRRDAARCCDDYGERVLIGEIYLPLERLVAYYGPDLTRRRTCRSTSS